MLDRITASLPSLAPAEQRVARLVLADPRAFARQPVRELAERAHVSRLPHCVTPSLDYYGSGPTHPHHQHTKDAPTVLQGG
jgi:hypothetical protein